jgi:hypothetical protein
MQMTSKTQQQKIFEEPDILQRVKIKVDNITLSADSDFTNGASTLAQEQLLRPIPHFTTVSKSLHFALNWSEDTVDRLTDKYNHQHRLMSREQYQNLVSSIEKIHEYMQETITSNNTQDILDGLEKLFNGGHISNYQQKTYIARYKLTRGYVCLLFSYVILHHILFLHTIIAMMSFTRTPVLMR